MRYLLGSTSEARTATRAAKCKRRRQSPSEKQPIGSVAPVLIYRRTGNLRAVQLLLGYSKIESTVRYLGIEVDDAIEIVEKIDI